MLKDTGAADKGDIIAGQALPPFEIIEGAASSSLILVCDHAGNAFPEGYDTLGLDGREISRHIAYDIGAGEVARLLAGELGAPAVVARYSRLLIDLNRGKDDPTLVMQLSDGAVVPGNCVLTDEERERRIRLYYEPYHDAIDRVIDETLDAGRVPAILSVHSFTEIWRGTPRPWHVTVLWDKDPRLAHPLLERLAAEDSLTVAENVPYSGEIKGDCMYRHGTIRGLAHALIEIRQDLVRPETGQRQWAGRLAGIMRDILADPTLAEALGLIEQHGSNTDRHHVPSASDAPVAARFAAR